MRDFAALLATVQLTLCRTSHHVLGTVRYNVADKLIDTRECSSVVYADGTGPLHQPSVRPAPAACALQHTGTAACPPGLCQAGPGQVVARIAPTATTGRALVPGSFRAGFKLVSFGV
jgi:hypothetical protein